MKELVKKFSERGKIEFEWLDDPHYGQGVYVHPDGSKYNGHFKAGSFSGEGIFKWPDGSEYNGQWKNGLPDGKGLMIFPDGSRYESEWKKGHVEGKVTIVLSSMRKGPPKRGGR